MTVSLQTIVLYNNYDSLFYNAYLPFIFGGFTVSGTADNSALFITFCFTPNDGGSPTGHVNASRSREFTVSVTSPVIANGNYGESQGTLWAVGNVINFWLISSGNLFLRFS